MTDVYIDTEYNVTMLAVLAEHRGYVIRKMPLKFGTGGRAMNRLTDRRTAEALRSNIAGLRAAGIEPSVLDVMYVKLADYEDADERREQTVCNYDPDEWYE